MGKEEAEGVMTCTGHLIPDVLPLLIDDITTTEFSLHPDFSVEEIHDVATTILDSWSDDVCVRQKIALDAIVEYRKPVPLKAAVTEECKKENLSPTETVQKDESVNLAPSTLTYHQQLTIAALQGMCANPAYRGDFDDLPFMAVELAAGVINLE